MTDVVRHFANPSILFHLFPFLDNLIKFQC